MDRLIIRGEPVGPFQHVYAYVNGEKVASIGIGIEDLVEVVFAMLEKYNIDHIDLSGSRFYMEGIETKIKEAGATLYSNNNLIFKYV